MPIKTYETIGTLNRYTSAIIDGIPISISFINGTESPRVIQGRYTTKEPKIQQWIENSGNFNKKYRLVKVIPLPGDVQKNDPVLPDDDRAPVDKEPVQSYEDDMGTGLPDMGIMEDTDEDVPPEEPVTECASPLIIDSVLNGQQARNYLIEHYKDQLTFRQLGTNAQLISEAKQRGIQFINWEAFVTSK